MDQFNHAAIQEGVRLPGTAKAFRTNQGATMNPCPACPEKYLHDKGYFHALFLCKQRPTTTVQTTNRSDAFN